LRVASATDPAHGSVEIKEGVSIIYTPDRDFSGTDVFTYTVKLGSQTDEANVTVTVLAENIPPTVHAGRDKTVEVNQTVHISGGAKDDDGMIVSYRWTEGSTVLSTQASFDYRSSAVGVHTLRLTATDNDGASAWDEMNVTVIATPDPSPSSKVFFDWNDGTHGNEPWVSDGTVSGTMMLQDIAPDGNSSWPSFSSATINGEKFFAATTEEFDRELWKTDGTTDGTVRVKDIATEEGHGSWPQDMCVVDNTLYFFALDGATSNNNNTDGNTSIWKSTGEIGNATKVQDFGAYAGTGYSAPGYLRCVLGKLLFQRDYDSGNGSNWNPWVSDGVNPATRLAGSTFEGAAKRFSWNGVVFKGKYYTVADDGEHGSEVWMSDLNSSTNILKDINSENNGGSNPSDLTVVGDKLFFVAQRAREASDPQVHSKSLWVTDGSEATTVMILDDNATPPNTGDRNRFSDMTAMGDKLYFVYQNLDNNHEPTGVGPLYVSNGTTSGTYAINNDLNVSADSLIATSNMLYVWAYDNDNNSMELYRSDGITVQKIRSFGDIDLVRQFTQETLMYFEIIDWGTSKRQLWRTDGTNGGTIKLLERSQGLE
jgi:ELWxxDGT repeat protein